MKQILLHLEFGYAEELDAMELVAKSFGDLPLSETICVVRPSRL